MAFPRNSHHQDLPGFLEILLLAPLKSQVENYESFLNLPLDFQGLGQSQLEKL